MEKKPNKKDELSVVNNVLKLAMKLMKVSCSPASSFSPKQVSFQSSLSFPSAAPSCYQHTRPFHPSKVQNVFKCGRLGLKLLLNLTLASGVNQLSLESD